MIDYKSVGLGSWHVTLLQRAHTEQDLTRLIGSVTLCQLIRWGSREDILGRGTLEAGTQSGCRGGGGDNVKEFGLNSGAGGSVPPLRLFWKD